VDAAISNAPYAIQSERASHRHALPPILLGLLTPMVLFLLIDPRAVTNANLIAHVYMIAIFVVAAAAYLISVFETGEISRVVVDRAARTVMIERTGLLAKSQMMLSFRDITTVRVETKYDDDGYQQAMPSIVLTTRELIPLPAGTNDTDVATLRAMIRPT
jgi:hypothetical protein